MVKWNLFNFLHLQRNAEDMTVPRRDIVSWMKRRWSDFRALFLLAHSTVGLMGFPCASLEIVC